MSPSRAKPIKQRFGIANCGFGWSIEPLDLTRIADPHGAEIKAELRKITAQNLRGVVFGTSEEILLRVQTNHPAGTGASSTPGTLLRRGFADATYV